MVQGVVEMKIKVQGGKNFGRILLKGPRVQGIWTSMGTQCTSGFWMVIAATAAAMTATLDRILTLSSATVNVSNPYSSPSFTPPPFSFRCLVQEFRLWLTWCSWS